MAKMGDYMTIIKGLRFSGSRGATMVNIYDYDGSEIDCFNASEGYSNREDFVTDCRDYAINTTPGEIAELRFANGQQPR